MSIMKSIALLLAAFLVVAFATNQEIPNEDTELTVTRRTGHYTEGAELIDSVLDVVRKEYRERRTATNTNALTDLLQDSARTRRIADGKGFPKKLAYYVTNRAVCKIIFDKLLRRTFADCLQGFHDRAGNQIGARRSATKKCKPVLNTAKFASMLGAAGAKKLSQEGKLLAAQCAWESKFFKMLEIAQEINKLTDLKIVHRNVMEEAAKLQAKDNTPPKCIAAGNCPTVVIVSKQEVTLDYEQRSHRTTPEMFEHHTDWMAATVGLVLGLLIGLLAITLLRLRKEAPAAPAPAVAHVELIEKQ